MIIYDEVNACLPKSEYFRLMEQKRLQPGSKKGCPKPIKRKLDPKFSERLAKAMDARFKRKENGDRDVSRLAKEAGCTRAVVHKYLTPGESKTIEAHVLFAIADALAVSARWLLTGQGSMAAMRRLTPDESRAVKLLARLDPAGRELWFALGQQIMERQPPGSSLDGTPTRSHMPGVAAYSEPVT